MNLDPKVGRMLFGLGVIAIVAAAVWATLRGGSADTHAPSPEVPPATVAASPDPATSEDEGTSPRVQASLPMTADRVSRAAATAHAFLVEYGSYDPSVSVLDKVEKLDALLDAGAAVDAESLVPSGARAEQLADAGTTITATATYERTTLTTASSVAFVFELRTRGAGKSDAQRLSVTMTGGNTFKVQNLAYEDEFEGS